MLWFKLYYTRGVASFTQIHPCVLEKLVGFFWKDFLSIPQEDWGNSLKRICRHKESILIDYNSYKDLSGKFSHSN